MVHFGKSSKRTTCKWNLSRTASEDIGVGGSVVDSGCSLIY